MKSTESIFGHGDQIKQVIWDKRIYTASLDGTIRIWNDKLEQIGCICDESNFEILSFTLNSRYLFYRNIRNIVNVFDLKKLEFMSPLDGKCIGSILCDEDYILYQNELNELMCLDASNHKLIKKFEIMNGPVVKDVKIYEKSIYLVSTNESLYLIVNLEGSLLCPCELFDCFGPYILIVFESTIELFENWKSVFKMKVERSIRQVTFNHDLFIIYYNDFGVGSFDPVTRSFAILHQYVVADFILGTRDKSLLLVYSNAIWYQSHGSVVNTIETPRIHSYFIHEDDYVFHYSFNVHFKIGSRLIDYFIDSRGNKYEMIRENDQFDVKSVNKLKPNHASMKTTDLDIFWISTSEWIAYSSKYAFSKWMNVWEGKYTDFRTKITSICQHEKNLIVLTGNMKVYSYNMSDRSIVETWILSHPIERLIVNNLGRFLVLKNEILWNDEKHLISHDMIGQFGNVFVFGRDLILEAKEGVVYRDRVYPDHMYVSETISLGFENYNSPNFQKKKWRCIGKSFISKYWTSYISFEQETKFTPRFAKKK